MRTLLCFLILLPGLAVADPAAPRHRMLEDLRLALIRVEPGTFAMGSPADEPERHKAEGPRMQVTLTQGFWLGKTEVTQAQYEAVMGVNPSTFKDAGGDAPVERVSWIDAMSFCRKLSGNVLEWCLDWYGDYPGGAQKDPTGPERGYYRMAWGGSWRVGPGTGRSAARSGGSAGRLDYTIGFRLALCATP